MAEKRNVGVQIRKRRLSSDYKSKKEKKEKEVIFSILF